MSKSLASRGKFVFSGKFKKMFRLVCTCLLLAMALECADLGAKGPASIRQKLGHLAQSKRESCGLTKWSNYNCDTTSNNNYGCSYNKYCWRSCNEKEKSECRKYSEASKWCWTAGAMLCKRHKDCAPHAGASCKPTGTITWANKDVQEEDSEARLHISHQIIAENSLFGFFLPTSNEIFATQKGHKRL